MGNASKIVLKFVSITFSILITLLVIFGLLKAGEWAYDFGYRVFTESPMESGAGTDMTVSVTSDMSAKQIGNLLEEKGLIQDATLFVAQLKLSAYSNQIKTGTYTLNTSMTAQEMMKVMSAEEIEDTETET